MSEYNKLLSISYLEKVKKDAISIIKHTIFFGFIINLLMLAMPIYSLQVLDRVLSSGSMETLLMISLIVTASILGLNILQIVRSSLLIKLSNWIELKLAPKLIAKSLEMAVNNKTVLTSQILRELNSIKSFISGQGLTNVVDAPWAVIFLIVLFKISVFHGLLTVIGSVILLILALFSEFSTKRLLDAASDNQIRNLQQLDFSARNSEVISAMGMGPYIIQNWQKNNDITVGLQSIANKRDSFINGITRFFRFFLQILVTGIGGYLVLQGELSSGGMIAGSILVGRTLAPFESLIGSWKGIIKTRKSYINLNNLLADIVDKEIVALPKPEGRLEVENVSYSYPNSNKNSVNNINFHMEPGEVLAIIGESAAGKSTLARIITGIWQPKTGTVRLDSIDLHKWDSENRGQYIGYLPQDVELFTGTVQQNIARMEPNFSSQDVIEAAKLAGIHDLILRLPEGYNTALGPNGMSLSGGQRQRIALARAFYKKPSIIILDEPNSNLDQFGEKALAEAILRAKQQNITCIVITHRPTLLDIVDKILLLHYGQVTAFGDKNEIIPNLSSLQQQLKQNGENAS